MQSYGGASGAAYPYQQGGGYYPPNAPAVSYPQVVPYDSTTGGNGAGGYGAYDDQSAGVYRYDGGIHGGLAFGMEGGYPRSSSGSGGSEPRLGAMSPGEGGAPRFRVRMLPSEGTFDQAWVVICQVGLDAIKIIDNTSARTLKVCPLQNLIRWSVQHGNTFVFWARGPSETKDTVVSLQSDARSTTELLDIVTATCVQVSEMLGQPIPSGSSGKGTSSTSSTKASKGSSGGGGGGSSASAAPKTKGQAFLEWMSARVKEGKSLDKVLEDQQHWVPDEAVKSCMGCNTDFGAFIRKHHCRSCGDIFCDKCSRGRLDVSGDPGGGNLIRVCDKCQREIIAAGGVPMGAAAKLAGAEAGAVTSSSASSSRASESKPAVREGATVSLKHDDLAKQLEATLAAAASARPAEPASKPPPSSSSASTRYDSGGRYGSGYPSSASYPSGASLNYGAGVDAIGGAPGGGSNRGGGYGGGSYGSAGGNYADYGASEGTRHWLSPSAPAPTSPAPASAAGAWGPPSPYGYPPAAPPPPPPPPGTQEVICPGCNTHLQVQVPPGGQQTPVECGMCSTQFMVAGY